MTLNKPEVALKKAYNIKSGANESFTLPEETAYETTSPLVWTDLLNLPIW